jgi:N-formylglutamate amidohydrolase
MHIIFNEGRIPVIISVPHGGIEEPAFLPFRVRGNTRTDEFTLELAREFFEELKRVWSEPFFVAALIRRCKIDFNRPAREAYEAPVAEAFYFEYHTELQNYVNLCRKMHSGCLLLDIHGRKGNGPGAPQVILGTANYMSSDPSLVDILLNLLGSKNCSARHDTHGPYRGGYITRHYADCHKVKGIQLEISRAVRQDCLLRRDFARVLAESVRQLCISAGMVKKV